MQSQKGSTHLASTGSSLPLGRCGESAQVLFTTTTTRDCECGSRVGMELWPDLRKLRWSRFAAMLAAKSFLGKPWPDALDGGVASWPPLTPLLEGGLWCGCGCDGWGWGWAWGWSWGCSASTSEASDSMLDRRVGQRVRVGGSSERCASEAIRDVTVGDATLLLRHGGGVGEVVRLEEDGDGGGLVGKNGADRGLGLYRTRTALRADEGCLRAGRWQSDLMSRNDKSGWCPSSRLGAANCGLGIREARSSAPRPGRGVVCGGGSFCAKTRRRRLVPYNSDGMCPSAEGIPVPCELSPGLAPPWAMDAVPWHGHRGRWGPSLVLAWPIAVTALVKTAAAAWDAMRCMVGKQPVPRRQTAVQQQHGQPPQQDMFVPITSGTTRHALRRTLPSIYQPAAH